MDEFLTKTPDHELVRKLIVEIVDYVMANSTLKQNAIAKLINDYNSKISEIRTSGGNSYSYDKKILNKLIDVFEIKLNEEKKMVSCNISKVQNTINAKNRLPNIFFEEKGKNWKIVSIAQDNTFIIRILKILSPPEIEFHVNIDNHENYDGIIKIDNSGNFLVCDLKIKDSSNQDLRMVLYIGDKTAKPELMLGVLTYFQLSTNKIFSYKIVAMNLHGESENSDKKIPANSCKIPPFIKEYLEKGKNTRIEGPPGILNLGDLEKYLEKI